MMTKDHEHCFCTPAADQPISGLAINVFCCICLQQHTWTHLSFHEVPEGTPK